MSERGIKETSESYRKIRNTFRYLLGNLEDYAKFDRTKIPQRNAYAPTQPSRILYVPAPASAAIP